MHAVVSIAGNDLRLLLRDRTAFFFTVIFPVLFGLGFGFIFQATMGGGGGDATIRVAVVDLDGSDVSAAFVGALDDAADLEVVAIADEERAAGEVRAGAFAAAVVVPAGFGDGLDGVFAGEPLKIRGVVDPSRQAETAMVQGLVQAAAFQALVAGFTDPERALPMLEEARGALAAVEGGNVVQRALVSQAIASAEAVLRGAADDDVADGGNEADSGDAGFAFNPVEVSLVSAAQTETGPRLDSAFQITFPQGAAWGLVGCVTGFGLALVAERDRGTLMRLRTASIRGVDVLLGKSLACFVTATSVLSLTLLVFLPFGVSVPSPLKLAVVFVVTAWAFVGLMALLATATRSEQGAEGFVRAVLLVMALVGGAGVPKFFLEQVHPWLPYVSPFGWAIAGLEGATWRQLSWAQLATPLAVLMLIGTACFAGGLALFGRWKHH